MALRQVTRFMDMWRTCGEAQAAELAQVELARRMGVTQAVVSRMAAVGHPASTMAKPFASMIGIVLVTVLVFLYVCAGQGTSADGVRGRPRLRPRNVL
jgi:hypothetical protein